MVSLQLEVKANNSLSNSTVFHCLSPSSSTMVTYTHLYCKGRFKCFDGAQSIQLIQMHDATLSICIFAPTQCNSFSAQLASFLIRCRQLKLRQKQKIIIPSYSFIATEAINGVGDDKGSWWLGETLQEGEVVHEPLTV